MHDFTNIGSSIIPIFAGYAGGIAYALHVEHPIHNYISNYVYRLKACWRPLGDVWG